MYADFIRELQKELEGYKDIVSVLGPQIDHTAGTIRSGIVVLGIGEPVAQVSYNVLTKEYQVTDSVQDNIILHTTTSWEEGIQYVKSILESERLSGLVEEIKLLYEYGEI